MKKRIEATVRGVVQGVSFRYYCFHEAKRFGLTGYAINLPDGKSVKIIAEGEEADLAKLIEWLKIGPDRAKVECVDIEQKMYSGEFSDFEIK